MREIKYIDLFCGLGAFHAAFDKASTDTIKYTCALACDIDQDVRNIYEENYHIKPVGDINAVFPDDIPEFDILCAGFPCQPFSIAGKREGFNDKEKGNLFYSILRIVDAKNPQMLFLENVKNLHTIHNGKTFKTIVHELEKRGYTVSYKVIDSKYYNSPQSRKRIYIICNKGEKYVFKDVQKDIVPVSRIIDFKCEDFFEYRPKYRLHPCPGGGDSMMKYKLVNQATGMGGRQGERVYAIDTCGPTVCASSGGPGAKTGLYEIDGKIRTLTIQETLAMFGFGKDYKYESLPNKRKMLFYLGNSIVVDVLDAIIADFYRPSRLTAIQV